MIPQKFKELPEISNFLILPMLLASSLSTSNAIPIAPRSNHILRRITLFLTISTMKKTALKCLSFVSTMLSSQ